MVFGAFSYTATALRIGVAITPDEIMVTPIDQPGNFGVEFAANWAGQICPGEVYSSTCPNQVHLHDNIDSTGASGGGPIVPFATFAPVSTMQLVKDLRVYGVAGESTVSEITNQYPTPKPVAPLLCFSGPALVWAFRKRRCA